MAPRQRTLLNSSNHYFVLIALYQATRLVTASDDDNTPVVMVWDLRNADAPVQVNNFVLV